MSTVRLYPLKKLLPSKILIVEDDLAFQESLKRLLHKEGYEVSTAKEGEEALQKLERESFNLVITDIYLGHLCKVHGFDLLEEIAQKRHIPAIVLSAFGDCGDYIEIALQKGAYKFLNKPIKKKVLLKTIQQALMHSPPP